MKLHCHPMLSYHLYAFSSFTRGKLCGITWNLLVILDEEWLLGVVYGVVALLQPFYSEMIKGVPSPLIVKSIVTCSMNFCFEKLRGNDSWFQPDGVTCHTTTDLPSETSCYEKLTVMRLLENQAKYKKSLIPYY